MSSASADGGDNTAPSLPAGCHSFAIRVYYEDTDAGGIVYHASYLRFAERARTEWLRSLGFDHVTLARAFGVLLMVRRMTIDFRSPARLADLLNVQSRLLAQKGATIEAEQRVMGGSSAAMTELVTMQVTMACVNNLGRPVRLPAAIAAKLAAPAGLAAFAAP